MEKEREYLENNSEGRTFFLKFLPAEYIQFTQITILTDRVRQAMHWLFACFYVFPHVYKNGK